MATKRERERLAAQDFCTAIHPRLVGGLALYVGDRAVAEELAQEALLRALRRWERVSRLDSPEAWVWRVGINLGNSHFRRRGAERRAYGRLARPDDVATGTDPADRVALQRAVAALPERQRVALIHRYYIGLTVEQTAARMEISADAVRSLTKRGIAALRDEFAPAHGGA